MFIQIYDEFGLSKEEKKKKKENDFFPVKNNIISSSLYQWVNTTNYFFP